LADHDSGEQQNPSENLQKPYWIARSVSGFERYRNQRRTENDHESAADRSSRSTARATWAIAILTLVTIAVGGSQYIIFGRQLDAMQATREDGSKAMADQMAIMRDQVKTMQGQLD
jgi:hypothetical protein